MTDKEKIRDNIERRIETLQAEYKEYEAKNSNACMIAIALCIEECKLFLSFIDSMQKERTSEDLEEELEHFVKSYGSMPTFGKVARHFANWQRQKDLREGLDSEALPIAYLDGVEKGKAMMREQMMKEAVETEYWDGSLFYNELREKFKGGDKVKVIIIKEG